jgi:hypothetical protein
MGWVSHARFNPSDVQHLFNRLASFITANTIRCEVASNRIALPENGTEPEDPDGDKSVREIGILL